MRKENTMKFVRSSSIRLALGAGMSVLCVSVAMADGNVLKAGNVDTMSKWYGRAGGLVGADLVQSAAKPATDPQRVGITYDKDVVQRTNMPPRDTGIGDVSITYDKDVAARTNMPRGEKAASPITAGGAPAKSDN
jgi:hypothetical protein